MLVNLNKTVAFRCPACGEIAFAEVSLFELCSNKGVCVHCACGQSSLNISTENRNIFNISLPCLFCDEVHQFTFTFKDLVHKKCKEFNCPAFGFEIGVAFIGNARNVGERIEENELFIGELAEDLSFIHAGKNSVFMLKGLDKIRSLANEGNLFCECGSYSIDVDVSPNAMFLVCEHCGSALPITLESIKSGTFSKLEQIVIPIDANHIK